MKQWLSPHSSASIMANSPDLSVAFFGAAVLAINALGAAALCMAVLGAARLNAQRFVANRQFIELRTPQ